MRERLGTAKGRDNRLPPRVRSADLRGVQTTNQRERGTKYRIALTQAPRPLREINYAGGVRDLPEVDPTRAGKRTPPSHGGVFRGVTRVFLCESASG